MKIPNVVSLRQLFSVANKFESKEKLGTQNYITMYMTIVLPLTVLSLYVSHPIEVINILVIDI